MGESASRKPAESVPSKAFHFATIQPIVFNPMATSENTNIGLQIDKVNVSRLSQLPVNAGPSVDDLEHVKILLNVFKEENTNVATDRQLPRESRTMLTVERDTVAHEKVAVTSNLESYLIKQKREMVKHKQVMDDLHTKLYQAAKEQLNDAASKMKGLEESKRKANEAMVVANQKYNGLLNAEKKAKDSLEATIASKDAELDKACTKANLQDEKITIQTSELEKLRAEKEAAVKMLRELELFRAEAGQKLFATLTEQGWALPRFHADEGPSERTARGTKRRKTTTSAALLNGIENYQ